jgi:hypothetical protein
MRGEEALGGGLGFEQLHLPLAPADGQVGILRPVIFSQSPGSVAILQAQDP